ncbi:MAG TPA: bifunctional 2-C-methyl-D-erythritol 4-phosphate cytidylyltransferase/2-C-methyl-D-erythritol 2,4-cyclodiphosphate synthase [Ferrovibrio sp.]|jgi:2-C-methyl-D-erythritol 4-phosphate cytidylyltransferase/2-C-methyl-D-erythritol 2,4-cyclodiphosphate synthase|uniref:bifunctional 2-C-methyl-D-erythritol 4-phosphate cytidylyltransferase/2-C-methyl-D-erythritol 2,4-cyclodiphosphate synthase n=1 Tax=Ferrovibrio sp. TaxID=1917215 RepID=UPI002B4AF4D8|nr:bifunctional 2-C-methyl-D-erythritol 4-phosphate cytidylyltransferase/2-C-methyl-D-erythritol 2,4-cyclodiphosphate synthase [Ferrovibrio sp.]HLT79282.1 bifunctional 2-C-methyl-D-erythritol 4-phosphate cytidylyltransferase/2-C-methyl-D-erythritol 2,4-cyclodiphosphate synthase [Ferrovibrio sp.]
MTNAALIVAAGRGSRAGGAVPKQYQKLGGKPLLRYSLETCLDHPQAGLVAVVIHPEARAAYQAAIAGLESHPKLLPPIPGGPTRQESVRLGLEALTDAAPTHVLIHDAARPFLQQDRIDALLTALADAPGAILAIPVVDTLKQEREGRLLAGPDRQQLWRAQTPQAFRFADILAAHRQAAGLELTDDAAVAERAGLEVRVVQGSEENFKVTGPEDFRRAEQHLLLALSDIRTGQGFDVHAFSDEPGRRLMLGGIVIPHDRGLAGHSDADVALHALTDAILGALGEGDIGQHFPPSDTRWKNADSAAFLQHAVSLVTGRGGIIAHGDVTIVCEAPKIGPHREAMRTRIAEIAGMDVARISVKATTTEKLGFTGRREGIAAMALATIRLPA